MFQIPSNSSTNPAFTAKILVLGAADVGKTCLATRYVHDRFLERTTNTIGACFLAKNITVDGQAVSLQLWDTAGAERFRAMLPLYYRGAHAAILVFDVTAPRSFAELGKWVAELRQHLSNDIVLGLACNKVDLVDLIAVDMNEVHRFADEIGAVCIETSALTSVGVNELFNQICETVARKHMSGGVQAATSQPTTLTSGFDRPEQESTGMCCVSSRRR